MYYTLTRVCQCGYVFFITLYLKFLNSESSEEYTGLMVSSACVVLHI